MFKVLVVERLDHPAWGCLPGSIIDCNLHPVPNVPVKFFSWKGQATVATNESGIAGWYHERPGIDGKKRIAASVPGCPAEVFFDEWYQALKTRIKFQIDLCHPWRDAP